VWFHFSVHLTYQDAKFLAIDSFNSLTAKAACQRAVICTGVTPALNMTKDG
jgi:hypothetical protein